MRWFVFLVLLLSGCDIAECKDTARIVKPNEVVACDNVAATLVLQSVDGQTWARCACAGRAK